MEIKFVTVENYDLWGKLVKSWATGKNYLPSAFPDGAPLKPEKDDLNELRAQCAKAGVGIIIPDTIKRLEFIQPELDLLLIKLPPKEMILEKEKQYTHDSASYTLPDFYRKVFGNVSPKITDVLTLHAERIGDYTVSVCS